MNCTICVVLVTVIMAVTSCLSGCGGSAGSPIVTKPPHESTWTWVSGANMLDQTGVYGTEGRGSPSNVPGARLDAVTWTDKNGNLWLFGGAVFNFTEFLNDLWKYDGNNWTWVSGADTTGQAGVYGTQGTASPSNVPGARFQSASWIDSNGNLWLFGGVTGNSQGVRFLLNDLWKYDGSNWTWMGGANTSGQAGVYGTQGTASPSNVPGARAGAAYGPLNDLWKFDGTNWTWVSGADTVLQVGIYGTRGTASPANVPGARSNSISWTDKNGTLWLFGGTGFDARGADVLFNDLWKFDGSNWTWVSGSSATNQAAVYGTRGEASSSNVPSARAYSSSWIDSSGNLWLFGGFGTDSAGFAFDDLNDLWRFSP